MKEYNYEDILEYAKELNPDVVSVNGFDECIIGLSNSFDGIRIIYDERKIIEKLKKDMSEEKAWEHYEYNILGAYISNYSPIFFMEIRE